MYENIYVGIKVLALLFWNLIAVDDLFHFQLGKYAISVMCTGNICRDCNSGGQVLRSVKVVVIWAGHTSMINCMVI